MAALTATPHCLSRVSFRPPRGSRVAQIPTRAHNVEIEHEGKLHKFAVEEGVSILEAAEENGMELPHDCRLGVCMTCPAKLVSGEVDQSGSMLSEDVAEKGYALLCVSQPMSDCKIKTIPEEEVLDLQLKTSEF